MAVGVWVCKICGEAYIGTKKPSRCPFCGAYDKYLVDSEKYDDTGAWDVDLNDVDKANAEYQAFADGERVKHFFQMADLIEEYKDKIGHYPLADHRETLKLEDGSFKDESTLKKEPGLFFIRSGISLGVIRHSTSGF